MRAVPRRLRKAGRPGSGAEIPRPGNELLTFVFEGRTVPARAGQTVGAALLAQGEPTLRLTRFGQRPRGMFCGIGACFDCLVEVDGRSTPARACLLPAAQGQSVRGWKPTS